ncbi:MAG: helix-turn-helix domain-containing protein [Bacteroidales bacterium]|nr:helix-turn-helix domain-containing protein [Bacteroidales bacterium]
MIKTFWITSFFALCFLLGRAHDLPTTISVGNQEKCKDACIKKDWGALEKASEEFLKEAILSNDESQISSASFYRGIGQLYHSYDRANARTSLLKSYQSALNCKSDSLAALSLNSLGLLEGFFEGDYSLGQTYMLNALERARSADFRRLEASICGNLSEMAMLQNDTTGLEWAQRAYEIAKADQNSHTLINSTYCMAAHYHLRGNETEALQYLIQTDSLSHQYGYGDMGKVYALYASIYTSQDQIAKALPYFNLSLTDTINNDIFSHIEASVTRAKLESAMGHLTTSDSLAYGALRLGDQYGVHCYDLALYDLLSANAQTRNDYPKAYHFLQIRNELTQSKVKNLDQYLIKERKLNLDLSESIRDNEIQGLQIKNQRKVIWFVAMICALLGLIAFLLWHNLHRRKRLYQAIVEQQKQAIIREDMLATSRREEGLSTAEDKNQALWIRLCSLLDEEETFVNPQINRETIAEKLGTNRTYLSQVIKEKGGTSLSNMIKERRVRMAVHILTNATNDSLPMKDIALRVGFASESTFFRAFKESIGMSPMEFKKTVKKTENQPVEA